MKRIYKYELKIQGGEQVIEMPAGARILTAKLQRGKPCIWAIVDDEAITEEVFFNLFTTGSKQDFSKWEYMTTFLLDDGDFVLHLFSQLQEKYELNFD